MPAPDRSVKVGKFVFTAKSIRRIIKLIGKINRAAIKYKI